MTRIRPPAVAGTFYPADERELAAMVDGLLADAPHVHEATPPVALVAPHAGYVYSGPTAAAAYARLLQWSHAIHRVVVVGPTHRMPVAGLGLSSADAFDTPLGMIPLDPDANAVLLSHPGVLISDEGHQYEHSIEVHLPFLQRVLGRGWSLVPVVVGRGSAPTIADAFDDLWGAPGTLFVVSTDLSHYHDLDTARRMDRVTAAAIVAAEWERLDNDEACGAIPVRGALEMVRRRHEHVTLLDLRTSGDTAGPSDRVVGYGSFVIR